MAPVEISSSNLPPILFFGSQAALATAAFAIVGYFFVYAHRSLPPSTHTRSKHAIEHNRLAVFVALGIFSSFVAIFSKISWLISSYRHWQYEHNIYVPNSVWESGYSKILGDHGLQLGHWYHESRIWRQYYYGILENPTVFGVVCQALIAMTPFSLFVGIQGHHRNIPWPFLLSFVVLGQILGLSVAINLFFAAMILTPVPLLSSGRGSIVSNIPSSSTLIVPSLISITWVALVPAFLDFATWPVVCYAGYAIVPLLLAVLPRISAYLKLSKQTSLAAARLNYASVFRILAAYSSLIHVAELFGTLAKTIPPRQTLRHNYMWLYETKTELTRYEQIAATFGKIMGSLSKDPIVTGTLWDVLLTGASLSVWALLHNIQLKAIFNGLEMQSLAPSRWLKSLSSTTEVDSDTEPETTPRKRGRPKKSAGGLDGEFVPNDIVAAQARALESIEVTDDTRDQNTEGGAVTWVLFFLTGLGTALSVVLGAELSGG